MKSVEQIFTLNQEDSLERVFFAQDPSILALKQKICHTNDVRSSTMQVDRSEIYGIPH